MKSVIKTARTVEEAVDAALQELHANKDEATIEVLEEPSRGLFGLFGSKDAVVRVSVEDNVKEEILRDLRLPYVSKEDSPERMKPRKEEKKEIRKTVEQKPPAKEEKRVGKKPRKQTETKKEEPPVEKEKVQEESRVLKEAPKEEERVSVGKPVPVRLDKEEEPVTVDTEGEPSVMLLRQMLEAMDLNPTIIATRRGQILRLEVEDVPNNKAGLVIGRRGETLDAMQYLITLASHRKDTEYRKVIVDINEYRKKRDDSLRHLAVRSAERVLRSNRNMRLEPMNPYERRIIHSELQKMDGVHTVSEGQEPYRRIVIRVNRKR